MHEGRGAAVGAAGFAVRVLGKDLRDGHRGTPFLLVVGVGLGLDLRDDVADFRLALNFAQMLQAGQRRELDVEGGGELGGEYRLAAPPSQELLAAAGGGSRGLLIAELRLSRRPGAISQREMTRA